MKYNSLSLICLKKNQNSEAKTITRRTLFGQISQSQLEDPGSYCKTRQGRASQRRGRGPVLKKSLSFGVGESQNQTRPWIHSKFATDLKLICEKLPLPKNIHKSNAKSGSMIIKVLNILNYYWKLFRKLQFCIIYKYNIQAWLMINCRNYFQSYTFEILT